MATVARVWASELTPEQIQVLHETPMESWKLFEKLAAELVSELRDTLEAPSITRRAAIFTRGQVQFARMLLTLRKDLEPLLQVTE